MDDLIKFIAVLVAMLIGHPIVAWLTGELRQLRRETLDKKIEELKNKADKGLKDLEKIEDLSKSLEKNEKGKAGKIIGGLVGLFERFIITITFLYWQNSFLIVIAIWVGARVIGRWDRRDENDEGAFGSFLLGTGVSILFALAIAMLAKWIIAK